MLAQCNMATCNTSTLGLLFDSGLDLKSQGGRMGKVQKRVSAKLRSEELDNTSSSPEQEALSGPNGVQFKIELPKHYRTCHLFDGSIATAIYLRPSDVPGRNGKDGIANKANLSR